jgi:hypothetical protein
VSVFPDIGVDAVTQLIELEAMQAAPGPGGAG